MILNDKLQEKEQMISKKSFALYTIVTFKISNRKVNSWLRNQFCQKVLEKYGNLQGFYDRIKKAKREQK